MKQPDVEKVSADFMNPFYASAAAAANEFKRSAFLPLSPVGGVRGRTCSFEPIGRSAFLSFGCREDFLPDDLVFRATNHRREPELQIHLDGRDARGGGGEIRALVTQLTQAGANRE